MDSHALRKRRVLSPEKLKSARLRAGYTNVKALSKDLGIERTAYIKWEQPGRALTHVDYLGLTNALTLFGVTYEDVSDPLPTPLPAPAQASA